MYQVQMSDLNGKSDLIFMKENLLANEMQKKQTKFQTKFNTLIDETDEFVWMAIQQKGLHSNTVRLTVRIQVQRLLKTLAYGLMVI